MKKILYLFIFFVVIILASGCTRTVYLPAESRAAKIDTDSLTRLVGRYVEQSSSARDRETVYVYETLTNTYTVNERGDTTRADTNRELVRDRSRELETMNSRLETQIDSLQHLLSKKDSVAVREPYPVEKIVEVPRKRAWWETALLWAGGMAIIGLAMWGGCIFWLTKAR